MPDITIKVIIRGGAGGVAVRIQDTTLSFTESGQTSLDLDPGTYAAGVAGSSPEAGSVTVTLLCNTTKLGEQTFQETTFAGIIVFTVPADCVETSADDAAEPPGAVFKGGVAF